jgi:protein SCO1/2
MNDISTRNLGLILIGFIVLVVAALAGFQFLSPKPLSGTVYNPPKPMPDFTLQSANGPVSLSDFRGKLVILYFGYTYCPDACPLTMANLRQTTDKLGSKAKDVQVIFVSVDWKRDTPDVMAKYVSHFDPTFIGLSGTQEQIDKVTKDFDIFYLLNVPDQDGRYSVDHTASTQVLDRQGNLELIWPYDTQPSDMASDLRVLLKDSTNVRR